MRRGVLITGLLWTVVSLCSGCIVPSQEAIRKAGGPPQNSSPARPEMRAESGPLIKPTIPQESTPASQAERTPGVGSANSEGVAQMPAANTENPFLEKPKPKGEPPKSVAPTQPPRGQDRPAKQEWEDQKVRDAAVEMAKATPGVKQIKICYAVKKGEWWVILYQPGQGMYELKQYIWNKDSEKLEPFLVYKTIPADRLQQHLTEEEPGRACEVMELPSAGPGGQAVGPGT
jgi:hypothetical protein